MNDVVDGYEYVTFVEEQFTFQVFNLEPDLTFPGKIVGVDIAVSKLEDGSSRVRATLQLAAEYGGGANRARARLHSPSDTFLDIEFFPVDGNSHLMRAEFLMNSTMAQGYWTTRQITVFDAADNRRYEGQDQFGWMLFIDNPGEDLEGPIADVSGITSEVTLVDGEHTVIVYVPVSDENMWNLGGYSALQHYGSNSRIEAYARYDADESQLVFTYPVRRYHANGEWTFREVRVFDAARNERIYDLKEDALTFEVGTANPDGSAPELDVSSIEVAAVAVNPDASNGETDVTITYAARDDNSGVGVVSYRLQRPDGSDLFDYDYHENFYTDYFVGDPTEYQIYRIQLTLPPGSPPGTWLLKELVIRDKAGNILTSNFIELGILKPIEVP